MTERTYAETVPSDVVSSALAAITSRLVQNGDETQVLGLVIDACVLVLGASAGVMVNDPRGGIDVVATSDEKAQFLELFQSQIEQGPCLECIETGRSVVETDLTGTTRWPRFTEAPSPPDLWPSTPSPCVWTGIPSGV